MAPTLPAAGRRRNRRVARGLEGKALEGRPMDVSTTSVVERIARVLAGQRLSANAEGSEESAARQVDAAWRDPPMDAVAVLKTLREPDQAMAAAGDVAVWERMVLAALEQARPETVVL
jgi:hypothetical protein